MTPSANKPDNNPPPLEGEPPLQTHLDRGTFTGCLGILCVLALPAVLFMPVEAWHLPLWLLRLVPLIAIGMASLGAWLLIRVPVSPAARTTDPLHPLTSEGFSPVIEQPAQHGNRIGLILAYLFILIGVTGYAFVIFGATDAATLIGTLLVSGTGGALLLYTVLATARRVAVPAWRWTRIPIQGGLIFQLLPLTFVGLVMLGWALFIAAGQGYFWAPIGIGALIVCGVLIGPITQRLPRQRSCFRRTLSRDRYR